MCIRIYHRGFDSNGTPATNAARIPTQMNSWLINPRVPRISVGDI